MRQTENISQIQTVSVFAENIVSVKGMSDKTYKSVGKSDRYADF